MLVYRLCVRRVARRPLDGEGARLWGGRWNHPGTPMVYASSALSLAALELLVHVDPDLAPADLVALSISVPDAISTRVIAQKALPRNWRRTPAPRRLQDIGTRWAESQRSAVFVVPSAVIPSEHNYLLNPLHPDFRRIKIVRVTDFRFDRRLLSR
jgi:RES domain-containing protein